MQSDVAPHSDSPLPDEPEAGPDTGNTPGAYGLDGALVDPEGVSNRLRRRLQRQAKLYGSDSAKAYLAKLLELEVGGEDFYDRAEAVLGVSSGSLRRLIEGPGREP